MGLTPCQAWDEGRVVQGGREGKAAAVVAKLSTDSAWEYP